MDEAGDILQVVALFSAFYIVPAILLFFIANPRFFSYIGSLVGRIIADNIVTWCATPICMYLAALIEAKTVGGILWHLFFFLVLIPFAMPFWAIGGRVLVALYGITLLCSASSVFPFLFYLGFAGRFFDDKAAYLLFRSTMFAVILNIFVLYAKNIWEFNSQCYLITFTSFFSFSAFYWDTFLTSKALSIQIE